MEKVIEVSVREPSRTHERGLSADLPLYVDLDGTLLKTDMLWESLVGAVRQRPFAAFRAALSLLKGRAALKQAFAGLASLDPALLPYREDFVAWLRDEFRRGRRIILATAADARIAHGIAAHLGIFSDVLASDGSTNLKGIHKLEAIRTHCGNRAFAYCGNSSEDVAIFEASASAIVVNASARVLARSRHTGKVSAEFARESSLKPWVKALRPHQWMKNLLVFVPVLTAFRLNDGGALFAAMLAFAAFSLTASAGYLFNDLLDVATDRQHPRKRKRPFAAGTLSLPAGVAGFFVLTTCGLALAAAVSLKLLAWVIGYFVLTTSYSLWLKRLAIYDVMSLACLYTMRVTAGGAAAGITLSFWLLAFSGFLFLALALVKRCGELVAQRDKAEATARGRGYGIDDLVVLMPLGIGASCASVLVLSLYVQAPDVLARYGSPNLLWLLLMAVFAWQAQIWLVTARGEMHDDPLVYAIRHRKSLTLVIVMALAFGAAALLGHL